MKKILLFIFVFFLINANVFAESKCSYTEQAELLNKAANVKANYEVKSETVEFVDMSSEVDYFNITIYNLTNEFYIVIKNDYNNGSETFNFSSAKDGVINYRWNKVDKVTNFTIEVYSSGATNCVSEKMKTIYIKTPRFNEFYDREICSEMPDFYLCQKYVTSEIITESRFFEQLNSYQSGKIDAKGEEVDNRGVLDKTFDFIKDNKWYILGGLVIIAGGVVFISYRKSKKSRELGL